MPTICSAKPVLLSRNPGWVACTLAAAAASEGETHLIVARAMHNLGRVYVDTKDLNQLQISSKQFCVYISTSAIIACTISHISI